MKLWLRWSLVLCGLLAGLPGRGDAALLGAQRTGRACHSCLRNDGGDLEGRHPGGRAWHEDERHAH